MVRRKKRNPIVSVKLLIIAKCETGVEKIIVWVTEVKREITEEEGMSLSLR